MEHPILRVLFILKRRHPGPYGHWNYSPDGQSLPSGLSVSANQVAIALSELGIDNKTVQVVDNNCIDREVTAYKPTHVVIEAYWVVPEKFDVLKRLHPGVTWIVRNHSKTEFLANEGMAYGWTIEYLKRDLYVACNSGTATCVFKELAQSMDLPQSRVIELSNYYDLTGAEDPHVSQFSVWWHKLHRELGTERSSFPADLETDGLHIGCFGAIRPLKNHMNQALAAIRVADRLGVELAFHINGNRVEGNADPFVKNLRQLFAKHPRHHLIEHEWADHDKFLQIVRNMHLVSQVSVSETFNIVAADAVYCGVPVVGSAEIPWLDDEYVAEPNCVANIADTMEYVLQYSGEHVINGTIKSRKPYIHADQLQGLREYVGAAKREWARFLLGR
jgi:hypothetical protein